MRPSRPSIWTDRRASTLPEFGLAALFVMLVLIFTVNLAISFWMRTAMTMAAEVGARRAATFTVACGTLPATNGGSPLGGAPTAYATVTCPMTSASGAAQAYILGGGGNGGIRDVLDRIQAENVTITYQFTGLGFAGGPVTPSVTVTIEDMPIPVLLLGATELAPVAVTVTGEDLRNGGGG